MLTIYCKENIFHDKVHKYLNLLSNYIEKKCLLCNILDVILLHQNQLHKYYAFTTIDVRSKPINKKFSIHVMK